MTAGFDESAARGAGAAPAGDGRSADTAPAPGVPPARADRPAAGSAPGAPESPARVARGSPAEALAAGAELARRHAAAPGADGGGALDVLVDETLAGLAGLPPRRREALARFCAAGLRRFEPSATADDLAAAVVEIAQLDDGLARTFVRGYRAAGGDPGPDGRLAFLCALRALVAARRELERAGQLSGAAAQERMARADEVLALAERFGWRARLPQLVCITGLAASGKSTLAEALAAASGRTVLSSDRIRKLRAGVDPFERAAPGAYGDAESRAVYAELAQRAAATVRAEGGAIVEATFRRAADAEAFLTGAAAAAKAAWIVCEAPQAILLDRARARALLGSVADADERIVAAELAVHRGGLQTPGSPLARLDTTRPVAELLDDLARTLDLRSDGPP